MQKFHTRLVNAINTIEKLYCKQDRFLGIPTGFTDFDHLTSGLQPGNLIIIAARPSMGKTTLVLNIAQNVALEQKRPVVFFNLEMPSQDIAMRMLASESRIDFLRLRTGSFSKEHWEPLIEGASRLAGAPILINDDPCLTVQSLHDEALRLKNEHSNLALIIVDYLQMLEVDTKYNTREEDLSEISRALKILASKLNVPVIACSQLSREIERRVGKRRRLSDLRGSGAIGETADLVAFLHRDDYYEDENVGDRVEAYIMIKKQRNGPTGTVILYFNKNEMRFENPN